MSKRLRAWFASRTGRLVLHDGALAAAAAAVVLEGAHNVDAGVLKAAGLVGLKVLLRLVLPVPAGQQAPAPGLVPYWSSSPNTAGGASLNASVGYVKSTRTVVIPESPGVGRLGRHVEHDERSRAFGVTPHPAPKSVMWRRHVRPFDQGDVGSCTGNAMAGALSTSPFPHHFAEATAVLLYKAATRLDDVPGVYPPDDTGSSGLAVAKAAVARGWIRSYLHCFSLGDVIAALQDGPVIAGVSWMDSFDQPGPNGLCAISPTARIRGGHEVCLVGVDVDARTIKFVNSWSASWGDHGYGVWSWDTFERLLQMDGDVTVPRLT